ncbi:MAG: type II toxin-antitoxin system VapB family antitoxin [Candidatus Margulisiibacteriota bacterium]
MAKTLVNIKGDLLNEAKKATGIKKIVDVVNLALERLVRQKDIEKILALKGKVFWSGNLEKMREDRK